jgi:hypothetical protein
MQQIGDELAGLEKLRQVVSLLGLDDEAVLDRILALNSRDQSALSEDIIEKLDYHEVLNAPEPEVEEAEEDEE